MTTASLLLYGLPGDDQLDDTPEAVVRRVADGMGEPSSLAMPVVVEEWSARWLHSLVPDGAALVGFAVENAARAAGEDSGERIAGAMPVGLEAALDAVLEPWRQVLGGDRQADRHLRNLRYVIPPSGPWYLVGEETIR